MEGYKCDICGKEYSGSDEMVFLNDVCEETWWDESTGGPAFTLCEDCDIERAGRRIAIYKHKGCPYFQTNDYCGYEVFNGSEKICAPNQICYMYK